MSEQVTNLVQNYIAVWNERDAGKRRLLIDRVFTVRILPRSAT